MALLHDGITILNFDRTYIPQEKLRDYPHEWIDFADLSQTKRYCELDSFKTIQRRLHLRSRHGITFIGSGNYHYVSYLLLSEIKEPFTCILFDHHTDMMSEPSSSLMSCGSWVRRAIRCLPLLNKVIIIGAQPGLLKHIPSDIRPKVVVFPTGSLDSDGLWIKISQAIETDTVYISIDKDVLDPTQAVTDWDQGTMKLQDLLNILTHLMTAKKVYGADICGELPISPLELFHPSSLTAIKKNEYANQKILHVLKTQHKKIS
ncbi:arginase [Collibacillus ludicampi]|jgi:arginase family enzyme|uniref:Arginase n=1 Tax=Collibacillus ludicampi TaxID=2771369 RepID=A0AAV4LJL1_9BACL|nr:arginase family protein [Collibacillus ludicampi]GIM48037.1 arginase [Collibacillus ludicampi]